LDQPTDNCHIVEDLGKTAGPLDRQLIHDELQTPK